MVRDAPTEDDRARTFAQRLNGIVWRLRATRRIWRRGARPEMPLLEPGPPLSAEGRLDPPREGTVAKREPITFHGWARFRSGPVSRVEVWLGEEPLGRARLGVPRPDVSGALELGPGEAPGFELTTNLAHWPGGDGAVGLRAVATAVSGERLEIGPLPLEVVPAARPRAAAPAPERTPQLPDRPGLRTLVITHQLDLGGAQLYLIDLLRELLRTGAVNPAVVSARDGKLREELEALDVPVHVTGVAPTEGLASYLGRVEEMTAWAAGRGFEAAFVNTATSHAIPGVEVASRLGIPAVWAIHESFEPSTLWDDLDPAVRERGEAALGGVTRALFVAESTQRLFAGAVGPERGLTLPYGLDLDPIDRERAGFERERARREAGLPADAEAILCVGSIEPRKAQMPLAQAFDALAARHPRAHLVFVGGRGDAYTEFLSGYAAASRAAERIRVLPMTPDVQPWFGVADLVVCPSDVESLPRTVLEAMAWEAPVLATDVFGLPELIEDGVSGWLCEARDLGALTAALERALASSPEERRRVGRAGRALVEGRHSLREYGREVADLLRGVAADSPPVAIAISAS